MNPVRTRAIVQLTAAAVALGLAVAGCSSDDSSSSESSKESSSATSSAAATTSSESSAAPTPAAAPNYESLLMKAEDVPEISSGPWKADPPKTTLDPPPPDVSTAYTSGTNVISSSILITDDPASAAIAFDGSAKSVGTQVTGTPVPLPSVSPDAQFTSGTSTDGKSAMAALVFTVDRTVVVMVFGSAPGDLNPVPQDFAEQTGAKQVEAINAALPNLK